MGDSLSGLSPLETKEVSDLEANAKGDGKNTIGAPPGEVARQEALLKAQKDLIGYLKGNPIDPSTGQADRQFSRLDHLVRLAEGENQRNFKGCMGVPSKSMQAFCARNKSGSYDAMLEEHLKGLPLPNKIGLFVEALESRPLMSSAKTQNYDAKVAKSTTKLQTARWLYLHLLADKNTVWSGAEAWKNEGNVADFLSSKNSRRTEPIPAILEIKDIPEGLQMRLKNQQPGRKASIDGSKRSSQSQ